MPRRDPVIAAYEEIHYGPLKWKPLPDAPGWHWFRLRGSDAIHGPEQIVFVNGVLYVDCAGGTWKRREVWKFGRMWAGPIDRPERPQNVDGELERYEKPHEIGARLGA